MNCFRFLTALSLCLLAQNVQAVTLATDTFTSLPGTTAASIPTLAGTVVQDVLTPFSFSAYNGIVSGEVQNRVVLSIDGTYDFYWRIMNDSTSAGAIQDLRIGNFLTGSYDANYRIDGLGDVAPTQAYLFSGPSGNVNFNFTSLTGAPSGVAAGQSSNFFFLDTNTTSYSQTAVYDLTNIGQNQISIQYSTFAPSVPEPETYAMMFAGLGLVGFMSRRRRNEHAYSLKKYSSITDGS